MPATESLLPAGLLRECETLALQVAPELRQSPLYVVNVPPAFPPTGEVFAFTSVGAAPYLIRDKLLDEGRWRGPGTVVAFCRAVTRPEALGLLLHEIAHDLPYTPPAIDHEPDATLRAKQLALVSQQLNRPTGDAPDMPRWFNRHGFLFHRFCVHLHFRAWRSGFEIPLPEIRFAGAHYDLGEPWEYMRALNNEPRRMQSATFAEIASEKPPAEFRQLWLRDFHDWWATKQSIPLRPIVEEESNVDAA